MKETILILLFAITLSDNASIIWNTLIKSGMTKAGVAGTMGNLEAESGLTSCIYQTSYRAKLGNISNQEYCNRVNKGTYSAKSFIHDSVGFGLAQWTFWSLKQELLETCKGKIGDLNCQLTYLVKSLKKEGPWSTLTSSNDVRTCSNAVLFKYERPADQGAAAQNKRYNFAMKHYNRFK